MRFDAALTSALYSSALLLGSVHADEEQSDASSTVPVVEQPSTPAQVVQKPDFTVSDGSMAGGCVGSVGSIF